MRAELNIGTIANLSSAIDHYQSRGISLAQMGANDTGKEFFKNLFPKGVGPNEYDMWNQCDIHLVSQTWSNTAAGWGGIGGSALTTTRTTVIENDFHGVLFVYYGSTLAYVVAIDDKLLEYRQVGYSNLPGWYEVTNKLTVLYSHTFFRKK